MNFSKTRKLEIRKKYYEILKSYSNYNFVTDDLLLYLSKEEIDWKRHANETVIDVSKVEKIIPMKYLNGIPSWLKGTVKELIKQLVISSNPKKVI